MIAEWIHGRSLAVHYGCQNKLNFEIPGILKHEVYEESRSLEELIDSTDGNSTFKFGIIPRLYARCPLPRSKTPTPVPGPSFIKALFTLCPHQFQVELLLCRGEQRLEGRVWFRAYLEPSELASDIREASDMKAYCRSRW